jgi:hypothetical protein
MFDVFTTPSGSFPEAQKTYGKIIALLQCFYAAQIAKPCNSFVPFTSVLLSSQIELTGHFS